MIYENLALKHTKRLPKDFQVRFTSGYVLGCKVTFNDKNFSKLMYHALDIMKKEEPDVGRAYGIWVSLKDNKLKKILSDDQKTNQFVDVAVTLKDKLGEFPWTVNPIYEQVYDVAFKDEKTYDALNSRPIFLKKEHKNLTNLLNKLFYQ